jgi:hypothetical protein
MRTLSTMEMPVERDCRTPVHVAATLFVVAGFFMAAPTPAAKRSSGHRPRRVIDVAITVDDLPRFEDAPAAPRLQIHRMMLRAFVRHRTTCVRFRQCRASSRPSRIPGGAGRAWSRLGTILAITYSHAAIASAEQYLADVDADEPELRRLVGDTRTSVHRWKVFRYPSLIEGTDSASRAAIRRGLAARGYRIAPVTIDFHDWAYSEAYERCESKKDIAAVAALRRDFLDRGADTFEWARSAAQSLVGRSIAQILLLHVSRFDATMTDALSPGSRNTARDSSRSRKHYATLRMRLCLWVRAYLVAIGSGRSAKRAARRRVRHCLRPFRRWRLCAIDNPLVRFASIEGVRPPQ